MSTPIHGLAYDSTFLDILPILNNNNPTTKIRALSPSQFASLHLNHILAHPPDTVLFPFLHGIEGTNEAQNLFFGVEDDSETPVPRYRGLVWVICEDDLTPEQKRKLFKRRVLDPNSTSPNSDSQSKNKMKFKQKESGDVLMDSIVVGQQEDEEDDYEFSDEDDDDDDDDDDDLDDDESLSSDDDQEEQFSGDDITGREVHIQHRTDVEVEDEEGESDTSTSSPSSEGMQVTPSMPCAPTLLPFDGMDVDVNVGGDVEMEMDVDSVVAAGVEVDGKTKMKSGGDGEEEEEEQAHMHPVTHRRRTLSSQSESEQSEQSVSEEPQTITTAAAPTTMPPKLTIPVQPPPHTHTHKHQHHQPSLPPTTKRPKRARTPPLLTSTLRSGELLKKVLVVDSNDIRRDIHDVWEGMGKGSKWEFVPLKVPDGISLRNFGIQVPIYATLSDIVVYSPRGASPAAVALAERFAEAVERKREWRRERAGVRVRVGVCEEGKGRNGGGKAEDGVGNGEYVVADAAEGRKGQGEGEGEKEERGDDGLVKYNVFVLDADAETMRRELPHLVVRMCAPGGVLSGEKEKEKGKGEGSVVKYGERKANGKTSGNLKGRGGHLYMDGAHTIGTDGRIDAMEVFECEVEDGDDVLDVHADINARADKRGGPITRKDGDNVNGDGDGNDEKEEADEFSPNTVDFALREKEEMRDLTRASEIISVYPGGGGGGNSVGIGTGGLGGRSWGGLHIGGGGGGAGGGAGGGRSTIDEHGGIGPIPWTPELGQVFLGNADDVPLMCDPDGPMMHFHSGGPGRKGLDVEMVDGGGAKGEGQSEGAVEEEDYEDEEEDEEEEEEELAEDDPFNYLATNDPAKGMGYDICFECHDRAPYPSAAHLRAAEEHLGSLEVMWVRKCVEREKRRGERKARRNKKKRCGDEEKRENIEDGGKKIPPRPPPNANAVIHLPFPSSPPFNVVRMGLLMSVLEFVEKWLQPPTVPVVYPNSGMGLKKIAENNVNGHEGEKGARGGGGEGSEGSKAHPSGRRWSTVSSLFPTFGPSVGSSFFGSSSSSSSSSSAAASTTTTSNGGSGVTTPRNRSFTSPPNAHLPSNAQYPHAYGQPTYHSSSSSSSTYHHHSTTATSTGPSHPSSSSSSHTASSLSSSSSSSSSIPASSLSLSSPPSQPLTRPLKILIYSNDGYTESSGAALSLLMKLKGLKLPEAYLELQVVKRRSFFVYGDDLGILRKVEGRVAEERRERERREREKWEREREEERKRKEVQVKVESKLTPNPYVTASSSTVVNANANANANGHGNGGVANGHGHGHGNGVNGKDAPVGGGRRRPAAKSVSFAQAPIILPPPPTVTMPVPPAPPALSSVSAAGVTTISPSTSSMLITPSSSMITPITINTASVGSSVVGPASAPESSPTVVVPSNGHGHGQGNGYTSGHGTGNVQSNGFGHGGQVVKGRPRASTSPWLPSLIGDHQSWFNDSRFDGSFPSRVLPFLYLGNLNHASNAYMLHALGITHVVSVGECALVPPPHLNNYNNAHHHPSSSPHVGGGHFVPGKGPGGQGSLWIEEREGRIKVLDIKGICDDGIDTLEPQLEPICEWIDRARAEGGQVLVHCRVGVSRSATVVIAYVMKHLRLPLVDAYLIVRSRRLSVLIQPNMRLLYNLCGWEIKLAKERAGEDERRLKVELARAVSWPWLAREVHKLNEKYISS